MKEHNLPQKQQKQLQQQNNNNNIKNSTKNSNSKSQQKQKQKHNSRSRSRSREKKRQDINQFYQDVDQNQMIKIMGFSSFQTSKNKNHTNSAVQGVKKNSSSKRVYRQYMNRRGGFNRNLDKL